MAAEETVTWSPEDANKVSLDDTISHLNVHGPNARPPHPSEGADKALWALQLLYAK